MSSIQDLLYKGKDFTLVMKEASGDSSNSSLSNLFSDANKKLFERVQKPLEFDKKKMVVVDSIEEEESKKKKKNRKESREAAAAAAVAAKSENSNSNSDSIESDEKDEESSPAAEEAKKQSERDARTLFVGNFPVSETVKAVKSIFSEFGEIESVRFRSVPISGTAVDDAGNQNLVKKVCAITKKLGDQKQSCNAYIVFSEPEAVDKAIESTAVSGSKIVGGRHIRLDRCPPSLFDHSRSLFIGGLPYYTDEEDLAKHFANVLPGGFDDIEGIRIVRDPETLVCKGIAYILFKDRDAVMKGLALHKQLFKKRELRVQSCGKRTKRTIGGPDKTSTTLAVTLKSSEKKGNKRKVENESSYERRLKTKHEGRKNRQAAELGGGSGAKASNTTSSSSSGSTSGSTSTPTIKPAIEFLPKAAGKISQLSIEEDLKRRRINLKTGNANPNKGGGHKKEKNFKQLSGGMRRAIKAHGDKTKTVNKGGKK